MYSIKYDVGHPILNVIHDICVQCRYLSSVHSVFSVQLLAVQHYITYIVYHIHSVQLKFETFKGTVSVFSSALLLKRDIPNSQGNL